MESSVDNGVSGHSPKSFQNSFDALKGNFLSSSLPSSSIGNLNLHISLPSSSTASLPHSTSTCSSFTTLLDVHKGQPIRICVKVQVPVQDHPNFNFVGKLLGPKGNSLKWLQEVTKTKMAVLGRGSMRDSQKEDELRRSNDPRYVHLNESLHVEIVAYAPAADAYSRVGHALHEVKRFLVPDYYDDIRRQQLCELGVLNADNHHGKNLIKSGRVSSGEEKARVTCSTLTELPPSPTGGWMTISGHRCVLNHGHSPTCYLEQSSSPSSSPITPLIQHHHSDCGTVMCYTRITEQDKEPWSLTKSKLVPKVHTSRFLPYPLHRNCAH